MPNSNWERAVQETPDDIEVFDAFEDVMFTIACW